MVQAGASPLPHRCDQRIRGFDSDYIGIVIRLSLLTSPPVSCYPIMSWSGLEGLVHASGREASQGCLSSSPKPPKLGRIMTPLFYILLGSRYEQPKEMVQLQHLAGGF